MVVAALLLLFPCLVVPAQAALVNGDFESGIERWSASHAWYERPPGGGLSEMRVVEGEGRNGSKALKMVGGGKRGIAMQVFGAYPGQYSVSGWIKCENLNAGHAQILVEWLDRENKWMSGEGPGTITGTEDWTRFEKVITAPAGTRSVHLDLLTSEPNEGTVWFDDLEFGRVPGSTPKPAPPAVTAKAPVGSEGCLQVSWDPKALTEGTVRLLIFCEPGKLSAGSPPLAVADGEDGTVLLRSLENGTSYAVAAVAVNADGKASGRSKVVRAVVSDRQAPRPGWLQAEAAGRGRARVSWSPHVLDLDVKTVHFVAAAEAQSKPAKLAESDAIGLYREARPLFCTQPWITKEVALREGATRIGVFCVDGAGNRGQTAWTEIRPEPNVATPLPAAVWTAPPTTQVARDSQPPAQRSSSFELTLMRGQAKGFQVFLRPDAALHGTQVRFQRALHEDGKTSLDTEWLAYHFVDFVNLEANSRATPPDELLWKAPADYPDELSEELRRDLAAGQVQPVYIRVTAPRAAKPGVYRGTGTVVSDEGSATFDFVVRVATTQLPERPRLKFVYWFSWDAPCKELGVEQYSEEGWRVLSRLGELMRVHHQNVVVVPWSLVRTWRRSDGVLAHDFRDFDRFIRTFQAQGVDTLFCLSHVGSRTTGEWLCPTMGSHGHRLRQLETGEEALIDVLELLPALERHLTELKLVDRFTVHVADEPIPQNVQSYRELSEKVRQAAPRLRRIDAIHLPGLEGALEVWVPQLNYFEQFLDRFKEAQAKGNELWFYIAWVPQGKYPNRMIDSAAVKSRVLHWLNALYDTTGYLHWALNHWSIPLTSLESPGDQYLCWPSKRYVANSSLRYEAEREGLEDCELLFMVRDALMKTGMKREEAQARMEALGRKAVRAPQDYTRSWEELEVVRSELLAELESVARGKAPK